MFEASSADQAMELLPREQFTLILTDIDEMPPKLGFLAKPYRAETLLHIVDDALA